MKRLYKKFMKPLALLFVLGILLIGTPTVLAAEAPLVTSVDELTTALMNAKDGDTILVGDEYDKQKPYCRFKNTYFDNYSLFQKRQTKTKKESGGKNI